MPGSSTTMPGTRWGRAGKTLLVLTMLANVVVVAGVTISIGEHNFRMLFLISTAAIMLVWTLAVLLEANVSTAKHPVSCLKPCCTVVYRPYPHVFRNTGGVRYPLSMSPGDCRLLLQESRRDSMN